jgi:hypothetical protein
MSKGTVIDLVLATLTEMSHLLRKRAISPVERKVVIRLGG